MLKTILQACENFCLHQIRLPYQICDVQSKKRTLIAYIDISRVDGVNYRVYVAAEPSFMQRVSKLFLEEDESDEETLIDMILETSNLIIGSAKVIAQESGQNAYVINTPHFLKVDIFDLEYDEARGLKINDDKIIIAIKELNG
ncbi:chemotaxis protein CheX [bacterium]|nr:chemotaxis protein CheX [bacterium]